MLPKSVTPSRIEENFKGEFASQGVCSTNAHFFVVTIIVVALPPAAFELLEKAATSHKPLRTVDPSKRWGVDIWA